MPRPIVNLDELTESNRDVSHGERFEARFFALGPRLGAKKLGYNLTVVPPGKRAFPFHNHHNNEEMFYIVSGSGQLRYGAELHDVRAGDVIACVAGGPEHAHQLINTGEDELRYLAVSTTIGIDVFQYPDSGKFGVVAGREPGMRPWEASFNGFWDEEPRKEYWDRE